MTSGLEKQKISKEKVKKKTISGKAYDIHKQTIYPVSQETSTFLFFETESKAHYAPEPPHM